MSAFEILLITFLVLITILFSLSLLMEYNKDKDREEKNKKIMENVDYVTKSITSNLLIPVIQEAKKRMLSPSKKMTEEEIKKLMKDYNTLEEAVSKAYEEAINGKAKETTDRE